MVKENKKDKDKSSRGNASQFFVAGELCRRGLAAVVTMGNTPNTDILCSNKEGTKFVHVQVKTFVPGNRTCSVGTKAEIFYGENFFWVLGGIPLPITDRQFEYYVIPAKDMAENVSKDYSKWRNTPGANGRIRKEHKIRAVQLPPFKSLIGWDLHKYLNRWDLIEEKLKN
jgi:hypothetical protein